ncbi:MAG: methyltransferase domain-containing protein [bacterium]
MFGYLIELGRESLLCASECASVLAWQAPGARLEAVAPHLLLVESEGELASDLFDQLGGVVRVARCMGTVSEFSVPDLLSEINPILESLVERKSGERVVFGLSLFLGKKHRTKSMRGSVSEILTALKEQLRERGFSGRFIEPHEDQAVLSSAQVGESKMLENGFEIVAAKRDSDWLIGSTCWIQDYSGQSARDYERPQADPKSGMLPPKLARMMVNLARGPKTRTILDPFCGSGGILMEACLLGLSPTGLDCELDAVKSARENCDWLRDRTKGRLPEVHYTQGDATEMRHYFDPLSFDCVVTEPYLGPPLTKNPPPRQIKQTVNELTSLYREALAEIRIVTRTGGRVVFVAPRFRDSHGEEQSVPVGSIIRLAGYRAVDPLSQVQYPEKLDAPQEELRRARTGVLSYSRPGQYVTRMLHLME